MNSGFHSNKKKKIFEIQCQGLGRVVGESGSCIISSHHIMSPEIAYKKREMLVPVGPLTLLSLQLPSLIGSFQLQVIFCLLLLSLPFAVFISTIAVAVISN